MSDFEQLNKLRTLLKEIGEAHGVKLEMFTVDPLEKSAKTLFKVTSEAFKSLEEKEQEEINAKFDDIVKNFKL